MADLSASDYFKQLGMASAAKDAAGLELLAKAQAAEKSGGASVSIQPAEMPAYEAPRLLGQPVVSPQIEQAAATGVLPSATPTVTSPPVVSPDVSAAPLPGGASMQPQIAQQVTRFEGMVPLSKADQMRQTDAFASEQDAIKKRFDAEAKFHEQQGLVLDAQNRQLADQAVKDELARKADAERNAAAQAKFDDALTNFERAKVNPNRAYENMGVGGRILATIGQALGAFGAAITHSPNYAQQMIDRAIDADIRAQEGEIAKLGQRVNMAQNRVAFFRQQGLDAESARSAAKASLYQSTAQKIAQLAAETGNETAKVTGQQLIAENEQKAVATIQAQKGKIQTDTTRIPAGGSGVDLDGVKKLHEMSIASPEVKQLRDTRDASRR